jgi:putative transposase
MKRLGGGYTKYFNYKNERNGALFQGKFKSIHIKSENHLLYLSAYINGNPEIHKISNAENWIWSSYQDYLGNRNGILCNKEIILNQLKSIKDYRDYVKMVINESAKLKDEIKEYLLE